MLKFISSVLCAWLFLKPVVHAETIHVAVASNFSLPMQHIVMAFEKQFPHRLKLSYGSSGKFFAQITHGAPYDVFFSADQAKPKALVNQQLALASSQFTYALGALALWSADTSKVDPQGHILNSNEFNKLAFANPKLAPYGQAALDVLNNLQLIDSTQARWVQGENIAQTYQFVASQNADIGFVALSQIMQNGQLKSGSAWIIPPQLYQAIKQDAVILQHAAHKPGATQLIEFMHSPSVKEILLAFGYQMAAHS